MLIKKLPHIFLTLLVGLLIGCGSTNPFADEAQSHIQAQDFEAALSSAEESIKNMPGDPLGYYFKAVALGEIAGEMEDPAERADYYKRMNEAFEMAEGIADTSEEVPSEIERIPTVRNVIWQTEHNRAVQLATDDSLKQAVSDPLTKSVQHLQNATIIQPDSSLSWAVLAQVAGMNKDFEQAASAKEKHLSIIPDTAKSKDDFLQLAQYYYQLDDQESVLKTLEAAQELFPTDEQIVSNLADSYTRLGQPEKAIQTVESLVEQNPENPQYRLSYGTQIYQKALGLRDSVTANDNEIQKLKNKLQNASGSASDKLKQQISELEKENQQMEPQIEELTNQAEEEINQSIELRPDNAAPYNVLGAIYQNRAKDVFDIRNQTSDNAKASELDKQGKDLIREAMGYYEKATEIDPDNQAYWRSLFQIYTLLGMDEKAQEAMKKAGMQ